METEIDCVRTRLFATGTSTRYACMEAADFDGKKVVMAVVKRHLRSVERVFVFWRPHLDPAWFPHTYSMMSTYYYIHTEHCMMASWHLHTNY